MAQLITPEIANLFSNKHPFKIKISLYGINEKSFSNVTMNEVPFSQFISGLDLLNEYSIPFTLIAMMLSLNKESVKNIEKFAQKWSAPVEFSYYRDCWS